MRQIDRNDALNIVYNAARAIEDLPITDAVPVIRCEACANWDQKSGLTARRCAVHGHATKRLDYCSYGKVKDNAID